MEFIVRKMKEAVDDVVKWGYDWGCRFSVEKTQMGIFTNKRVEERLKVRIYGEEIERVGTFKFLGVNFDSRLAEHIK